MNNSIKLRRGKAPVGVFTLNECLFQGKSVSEGEVGGGLGGKLA